MEPAHVRYLGLLEAISGGDWGAAEEIFAGNPSARTAPITARGDTPLHVALQNNSSQSRDFVQRLVEAIEADPLEQLKNGFGDSVLHSAAIVGNAEAAKLLARKAPGLLQLTNLAFSDTPIHSAARYGHAKTVCDLLSDTGTSFSGHEHDGVKLLNLLIFCGLYGVAFDTLRKFPSLAREQDENDGPTALLTLARKPLAFPSGSKINGRPGKSFWSCITPPSPATAGTNSTTSTVIDVNENRAVGNTRNDDDDEHGAMKLLKLLITEALRNNTADGVEELLKPPMLLAAESGISDMVTEIIKAYPDSIRFVEETGRSVFHLAVHHRRVEVFNIFYQLSTASKNFVAALIDNNSDNLLHLAGRLAAETVASDIVGLQRESLWFIEVGKVVPPSYREMTNQEGMNPRQVLNSQRRKLMVEGERWIKATAGSLSLVAALVVTVSFAAGFTLPGDYDDEGTPNHVGKPSFMVFLGTNGIALFSSSASLVMIMRIMTSNYSAADFVESLPMKIEICLMTLVFSITAMLAAFIAAMHMVIHPKVELLIAPVLLVAAVPALLVSRFVVSPFGEWLLSKYGPNVFGKQSDDIIA